MECFKDIAFLLINILRGIEKIVEHGFMKTVHKDYMLAMQME
ncbi:hypothetical protein ACFFMO_00245 [Lederbergia wuyishanensis]